MRTGHAFEVNFCDNSIVEPARKLPIYDKFDVLVVGGGPAGVGAALAAARAGMETLVVERYGCLGGIWTAGLLNPYFDASEKGGIATEILDRLECHDGTDAVDNWLVPQFKVFNYESMKYILDSMAIEAGLRTLFYTQAVGVILEGADIRGVVVENKSGRSTVLASVIVDCSGDGDVAYHAGCKYELGRHRDGLLQPMTLEFKVRDFKYKQPYDGSSFYELLLKFNKEEELADVPFTKPAAVPVAGEPDTVAIQWTHIHHVDGTNADDLTGAVIEGRRQVQKCMEFLKAARQEVGDVRLAQTAMQVGVRETRRIMGEYYLTAADLFEGRSFNDGICPVDYAMDIHEPDSTAHEYSKVRVKPYEIPYRCLVPVGIDQLLVAGRCISGSHEAHASYRVTGNCVTMGQAAGVAAALSVLEDVPPRQLDGTYVRKQLVQVGVNLDNRGEYLAGSQEMAVAMFKAGKTLPQIVEYLQVDEQVINDWMMSYPFNSCDIEVD